MKKLLLLIVITLLIGYWRVSQKNELASPANEYTGKMLERIVIIPTPTVISSPVISPTTTKQPIKKVITIEPTGPWGVAQQVDEVTWTMKIQNDERMATPAEVLVALNQYRRSKGVQELVWDDNLAKFASDRAHTFATIKSTDKHEGFKKFMDDNGFEKLGFTWVGENSSYGYRMLGVHLIEWIFAGDKPHDDNQLNSRWNYVGVGIEGTAVDIIFGTGKK